MFVRTIRGAFAPHFAAFAALALAFGCSPAAAQIAPATGTPPDPFTVENLIGDAVSLSNQAYPDVEQAIKRFKNSDVAGAQEYLEQAKKQYPKLPPVELSMAKLHIFNRNGQDGRVMLEATVTNHPEDPEAYLLLADLAFTEGRTTEAGALFDFAAGLTEKFADNEKRKKNFQIRVLAGRAAVFERRAKWQDANALLTQWVALDPESAAAHTRLGMTLFHLKKQPEALAEFTKARELRPDSAHPEIMLGQLYTQAGDVAKAREAFAKAYAADQKNEGTARAYAEWLIQQNDLEKAQEVAEGMRKESPDSIGALMLDGVVAKMRKQPKEAEEALKRVMELDPSNAGATNLLALILSESSNVGEQETALRHAQVNAERFQNNSQANVTLAWVLFKLGRVNEANAALQRGAQAGNLNADSAYLIAKILVDQKQPDQAKKALEQVLKQAGVGMFMYRKDAEALLKELGGEIPAPQAVPGAPASTTGAPNLGTAPPQTPETTPAPK